MKRYGKLSFFTKIFLPLEIKYMILFRKTQCCRNRFLKLWFRFLLLRLRRKTHIQIPYQTQIGKGFYIGHLGRIIINPNAVIGENCNIATGVTIGQTNGKNGEEKIENPIVGNDVWIGTNAVIVGGCKIGNDVLIAPGSYVNFDVPDHSVVIGNPGVVYHRENATFAYIGNRS